MCVRVRVSVHTMSLGVCGRDDWRGDSCWCCRCCCCCGCGEGEGISHPCLWGGPLHGGVGLRCFGSCRGLFWGDLSAAGMGEVKCEGRGDGSGEAFEKRGTGSMWRCWSWWGDCWPFLGVRPRVAIRFSRAAFFSFVVRPPPCKLNCMHAGHRHLVR